MSGISAVVAALIVTVLVPVFIAVTVVPAVTPATSTISPTEIFVTASSFILVAPVAIALPAPSTRT